VTRFEIVNPEALGRPLGFSHGILAPAGGRVLFIAGQTAPDAGHAEADRTGAEGRLVEQFGAALDRVVAVVSDAGGRPEHVARLTVYVTDMDAYRGARGRLGDVWRAAMGRHYPAMALVEVKRLLEPRARVEIQAVAVLA
jgi:enamine deaminase RidA (YjgF/YER057c/UK114 family)